jgi:hypothetical protein
MTARKLTVALAVALALTATVATASPAQAAFGISSFDGGAFDQAGNPENQAGAHPYEASAKIAFNTVPHVGEPPDVPAEDIKEIVAMLPPGLIGNPTAVPACPAADFISLGNCPSDTQIGVATNVVGDLNTVAVSAVYNLEPSYGEPAKFGMRVISQPVVLDASLSPNPPYNAIVRAADITQVAILFSTELSIWGVPADPAHDAERGGSSSAPLLPFLSLPTSCNGPILTTVAATSWLGSTDSAFFFSHGLGGPDDLLGMEGCNALDFAPTLQARPTTNVADAPSGLDVDLHIPQNNSCDPGPPVSCPPAEAHLKDTTVTLPEGLTVNPAGANGLGACSPAQVDLEGEGPASCPDASKLATVEVETPLLDHPVKGAAYIATPYQNPFNSLLALYIALNDPQTGTVVKLAGEVHPDPVSGQLSATFKENPQVPFEDFKLHFKGGPHGALRTPATCGTYTTTSVMTPWSAPDSGPPAEPSDPWTISGSPSGGACPTSPGARPNSPGLDAGTVTPVAGSYSPFVLNLRREDGSQEFSAVTLTPPPGLIGRLAGTPPCPEAALAAAAAKSGREEETAPSCPAASQVGTVDVAAGAGPAPYNAKGRVYLTGPYKGAPLSFAILTPATAGPFDLGTVVVRIALRIDPASAQITAVSDPIPAVLEGIPLDVRSAVVRLDKPDFTLNPTNCDPLAFSGQLLSTLGQAAPLSERFQVGECGNLGFKPKLQLSLKGGTRRGGFPALKAVLTMPPGGANMAAAQVTLPHSEFIANAHIGSPCTRVQYAANSCPPSSVIGSAQVQTPLLDAPLEGPIYLMAGFGHLLPDLAVDLNGQIHVFAHGRVDKGRGGGLRNTFEVIPDAPVSKISLQLLGGRKGLLENSEELCEKPRRATAHFVGQNAAISDFRPRIAIKGCKKAGHAKPKRNRRG